VWAAVVFERSSDRALGLTVENLLRPASSINPNYSASPAVESIAASDARVRSAAEPPGADQQKIS
jgi:hypothetical protein